MSSIVSPDDEFMASTYALKKIDSRYCNLIKRDQVEYPAEVQVILEQLEKGLLSSKNTLDLFPHLILTSRRSRLYLPKKIDSRAQVDLLLSGLYWARYLRPEVRSLRELKSRLNLVDLYLITANLFDRNPARKLLSYYSDVELYANFGRLGPYYYPKTYLNKQEQLDGFIALSLYRFGYFEVKTWSRPIQLVWHHLNSSQPVSLDNVVEAIDLSSFNPSSSNPSSSNTSKQPTFRFPDRTRTMSLMPLLRLAIMVLSSGELLPDPDSWAKFLGIINRLTPFLYREYQSLREHPHQLEVSKIFSHRSNHEIVQGSSNPIVQGLDSNLSSEISREQEFSWCILCSKRNSTGLCGHGVCLECQITLGTIRCPFCSEHFVTPDLSNKDIERFLVEVPLVKGAREKLQERVEKVKVMKQQREFKFDWSNNDYRLFKLD